MSKSSHYSSQVTAEAFPFTLAHSRPMRNLLLVTNWHWTKWQKMDTILQEYNACYSVVLWIILFFPSQETPIVLSFSKLVHAEICMKRLSKNTYSSIERLKNFFFFPPMSFARGGVTHRAVLAPLPEYNGCYRVNVLPLSSLWLSELALSGRGVHRLIQFKGSLALPDP